MASADIVNQIISMTGEFLSYMMPIIGVMTGIVFIVSLFLEVTLGTVRKTFRG